jgi:hypothetical protein
VKALPKLRLTLFGIALTSLFSVRPAQAYTVTLEQSGSNVVANGSGAINLTGLTFEGSFSIAGGGINPSLAVIVTGASPGSVNEDRYQGFSGPTSFGSGGLSFPQGRSGDFVVFEGFLGATFFYVPHGYMSGDALSSRSTWNNATFASLGATPGTYEWTWGTGLPNQNFTLIIGGAGVPDGGSTVSLLDFALFGLAALRRKLSSQGGKS